VYDIKPYIPWDRVGFGTVHDISGGSSEDKLRVPHWVEKEDDEFVSVTFTSQAREAVAEARRQGHLSPLYPPLRGLRSEAISENCEVCLAIQEIVAQDPRAIQDGRGKTTTDAYSMTFSTLRIAFEVSKTEESKCAAVIVAAELDPGDPSAPVGSYQHSLSLRRRAENEALLLGKGPIAWKHPVREGQLRELFALRGGSSWDQNSYQSSSQGK